MPGKFCPNCGRQNVDFYKGFCIECYSKMHVFTTVPKDVKIVKCRRCGMWLYQRDWIEDSFKNMERIIGEKVRTLLYNEKITIDMEGEEEAVVTVRGFVDEQGIIPLSQNFSMKIIYDANKLCPNCVKASGKYKELIIQLRRDKDPKDPQRFDRVETFIKNQTHKMMFHEPDARVFSFKEIDNGIDFIYGAKAVGEYMAKRIRGKYKIRPTIARKLKGIRVDGKKDIEVTYCFRA